MEQPSIDIARLLMDAATERRQGEIDGMTMAAEVLDSYGYPDAAGVVRDLAERRKAEPIEDGDP